MRILVLSLFKVFKRYSSESKLLNVFTIKPSIFSHISGSQKTNIFVTLSILIATICAIWTKAKNDACKLHGTIVYNRMIRVSLGTCQYSWEYVTGKFAMGPTGYFCPSVIQGYRLFWRLSIRGYWIFRCRISTGPKIILKYSYTEPWIFTVLYVEIFNQNKGATF